MPGPLVIPAIAAGAELVGQGIGALSQGAQNKKQREWNEKYYKQQRKDALADYHMQNAYNSPEAQMERLRVAGLNPNLVYGNGATAEGGNVRPSSAPGYNPKAASFDAGAIASAGIGAYYNTQLQQAQIDNLKVANTVAVQEAALKAAQVNKTVTETKKGEFDLGLATELRDTSLQAAQAALKNLESTTAVMLNRDEREEALKSSTIAEATQRILSLKLGRAKTRAEMNQINAAIENTKTDTDLKKADLELRKEGIYPGDPAWLRYLIKHIQDLLGGGAGRSKSNPLEPTPQQLERWEKQKKK